eukprot:4797937-Prymnesium_polylepis.1
MTEDQMVFRFRCVEAMLAAGVPISTLDPLRPLLEHSGVSLCESGKLSVFIPKIEARELERLKMEMRGQLIAISFDGTTRLGEALNTTGR